MCECNPPVYNNENLQSKHFSRITRIGETELIRVERQLQSLMVKSAIFLRTSPLTSLYCIIKRSRGVRFSSIKKGGEDDSEQTII